MVLLAGRGASFSRRYSQGLGIRDYFCVFMEFSQRQISRSTQLALREHGFYVGQRGRRGQVELAVEVPYEELLPLRLEFRKAVPTPNLRLVFFGAWLLFVVLREPLLRFRPANDLFWFFLGCLGLGLGLLGVYAWRNWWHQAIVHTSRLRVVLADHPGDRRRLQAFVQQTEAHAKAYLRREYGLINPLGLIEPQLRRLAWLHELDVLGTAEAQALATRLTGRLPGRGFKSMGQRLEALYVN